MLADFLYPGIVWWGRWSPDRMSSVRLSSGAFLVSPRVFRYQIRYHHLFLQMRTTSCQGSQIAIVARLHISVSCTLCLVHPSLLHWRSRCDSSGACTACCGRVYVAILTCLPICLSVVLSQPCQSFYHSVEQNVCPYFPVAVSTARDACADRPHLFGYFMAYPPASPIFERQSL